MEIMTNNDNLLENIDNINIPVTATSLTFKNNVEITSRCRDNGLFEGIRY